MALNRAPGTLQLSTMAEGVMGVVGDLAGWMASAIWRGAVAVSEVAVVSPVGPMVGAFVVGFTPLPVGAGSDRVPGRDIGMLAVQARLMAAGKVSIEPGMSSVNLPVRGFIRTGSDGRQSVSMVKTGTGGVPASVPVLNAVRDEVTGLDRITVPAVAGAPSRTILINPVPSGPTVPANTGNTGPVPKTPVHTGTDIRQADSIVTTTYPAAEDLAIQDFIYWQPDALVSGVEPIYVMLASPRDLPGKVTGKGEQVGDGWLDKAGQELGSPIPSQIADKLRGREFSNFYSFRRAVWQEVGKDPSLNKQFKLQNQANLKKSKSPFVRKSERVGERKRYELHHLKRIKDDGAVYDVDNIRVMTPKRHIDIHKGDK